VHLTTSNVNPRQFGQLFSFRVKGNIFAQPLVITNVRTASGVLNIVFVATTDDIVYAFDADSDTLNGGLIWSHSFTANGITPIPKGDPAHTAYSPTNPCFPDSNLACLTVFEGNLGIIGTPVIDRARGTLYVVVRTKEGNKYVQSLHALDISNGNERSGRAVIANDPLTTADGSTLSFAAIQNQRAGLALVGNSIVIAWGGGTMEGSSPSPNLPPAAYRGYVMVYDAGSLALTGCFTTGPEGMVGAGIWQSGRAPVIDGDGYVYYFTGNHVTDQLLMSNQCTALGVPFHQATALDNSMIKLDVRNGLSFVEAATPHRYWKDLDDCDLDLSGSGPMLIPGTSAIVGGGKQGFLHVFNKKGGKYTEISSTKIYDGGVERYRDPKTNVCTTRGAHHVMGGPVYWESSSRGRTIYISVETDPIKAFKFAPGNPFVMQYDDDLLILNRDLQLVMRTERTIYGHPAAILSLSANGNQRGSGILWAVHADRESMPMNHDDVFYQPVAGVLRAYDAEDLSRELWNSNMCPQDTLGTFAKFTPATVANGKVYMATFSGKLVVYGLLQGPRVCKN
jgi:outer membrane protein assembly factor BamB